MGHFGRRPIQVAWLCIVLPALICNYLGQGALILNDPKAVENPFYLMAPSWGLVPLVVLSTAATVIASQAVITGAYSLTSTAIQLVLLPRLEIVHDSPTPEDQLSIHPELGSRREVQQFLKFRHGVHLAPAVENVHALLLRDHGVSPSKYAAYWPNSVKSSTVFSARCEPKKRF
jgi:K+ transporter